MGGSVGHEPGPRKFEGVDARGREVGEGEGSFRQRDRQHGGRGDQLCGDGGGEGWVAGVRGRRPLRVFQGTREQLLQNLETVQEVS